ncbi:hypothetical protein WA026_008862 [Henosepilachna vigintioctopunctata]|uniref:Uncharacterized protein n=1 Tax=Henosepilachna vigintioctopunctata TaxID=420089 RepID=A0AAW1V8Y3_9CUCU
MQMRFWEATIDIEVAINERCSVSNLLKWPFLLIYEIVQNTLRLKLLHAQGMTPQRKQGEEMGLPVRWAIRLDVIG